MTRVHPSAVVGPEVELGAGTEVGPFCHLDGNVRVGSRCRMAAGVVVGSVPMDRAYRGEPTQVIIGDDNVFHEYATVHRSTGEGTSTVVGSGNTVMAYVHIAHNCRVGDGCTLTNGVQLAGHVELGDGVNVGGLAGVHQFCRLGELSMVGACSYVNKDIPPFMLAAGHPCMVRGVNSVGLRRAGVAPEAISLIRQAYRLVYRSSLNLTQALGRVEEELVTAPGPGAAEIRRMVSFIRSSRRGIELRSAERQAKEEP